MKVRAFDICQRDPWAITPEGLQRVLEITGKHANGDEIDIDAVSAKLGRPLDNTRNITVRDGVAIIPVSGPIFRFASFFHSISGATSVENISTDFNKALENPAVKSILFDVDSPGGQVSGIQELAKMIFDARGKKPMTTYSGDLSASAAYWLGSATDEFFAAETARIGSIGVVAVYGDSSKAAAKAGHEEFKFISSKSPRKQPDPRTEEGASDIQAVVDDLADIFLSDVARNRGVSVQTVEDEFGQGSVMIAEKALASGMIDGVSTYEDVLSSMTSGTTPKTNEPRSSGKSEAVPQAKETLNMSDKKPEEKKTEAIVVDRDYLNANHADLVGDIQSEAATAERERISGIMDNTMPGHEALATEAIEKGTDVGAFALEIVGAEKKIREGAKKSIKTEAAETVKIDADAPAPVVPETKTALPEDATAEEKAEAAWEDMEARDQKKFIGGKDNFVRAFVAEENGQVKTLKR